MNRTLPREIAEIEAELLAGNPDVAGLCLALSDWWAELRIFETQRGLLRMKLIPRRLSQLERAVVPFEHSRAIVKAIRASRPRRLEASGKPLEESPTIDFTGCRTVGEHIRRAHHVGEPQAPRKDTHEAMQTRKAARTIPGG